MQVIYVVGVLGDRCAGGSLSACWSLCNPEAAAKEESAGGLTAAGLVGAGDTSWCIPPLQAAGATERSAAARAAAAGMLAGGPSGAARL
jgi:hypothetical protein